MLRVKNLLEKPTRTEKEQKQVAGLFERALASEGAGLVAAASEIFFGDGANCYEPAMMKAVWESVKKSEISGEFAKSARALLEKNFWKSDKPAICAFVNFCQWDVPETLTAGEVEELICILVRGIGDFPEACFEYLDAVFGKLISATRQGCALAEELLQQIDDAFNKKTPETIAATLLIKAGERLDIGIESLCSIFSTAVKYLAAAFSTEDLKELRSATSTIFAISLKPERYLLLQSYFVKEIGSSELRSMFISKCLSMLKSPKDAAPLPCLYKAYSSAFTGDEASDLLHFMKRDFDQCLAPVRIVLQDCFMTMYELNAEAVMQCFIPAVLEMPWYSRMKKFVFPFLMKNPTVGLVHDLLKEAQNPQSKGFIAKCIGALAEEKLDVVVEGISTLAAPLSVQMFFTANAKLAPLCLARLPTDVYQKISIICDAVSTGRQVKVSMDDFKVGLFAASAELRVKSFRAVIDAEIPKTDEEFEVICKALDESLLTIDSAAEQAMIPALFEKLVAHVMVRSKKVRGLSVELYMKKMLSICCKRLVPTTNDIQRQMCLEMCGSIWKRFRTIGERENLLQFNSTMKDGQAVLKKAGIGISKYIERDDVGRETRMQIERLEGLPPLDCSLAEVRDFRILLQKQHGLSLQHEAVESAIARAESLSNDWERMSEWYLIMAEVQVSDEDLKLIASSLFNALMKTRKAGFVGACCPALRSVLKKKGIPKDLVMEFARVFISSFSDFDMAQMRRSAGLPFISMALMSSSSDVCTAVMNGLVELGETTENEQEETNVINTLRSAVRESDLGLVALARILGLLFSACYRFKNSWDVISAVDLVYVALLHKIWNITESETVFRCLSRQRFFSEVPGSRNMILQALASKNDHAIYLGLLVLTLFASDFGDHEIAELIEQVGISRSSRIRRTAARALISVLNVDEMQQYAENLVTKLDSDNCNALHFHLLVLCELKSAGIIATAQKEINTRNCRMIRLALNEWQGTNLDWRKQDLGSLIQMLKFWQKDQKPSEDLIEHLVSKLVVADLQEVNETLQIEGIRFLVNYLTPGSLTKDQGGVIVDLITKVDSVELQAALVHLLQFASDADVSPLIPFFIECSSNPAERFVPLQLAVSSIADLIARCAGGNQVVLMLMLNDIPRIRVQTAKKLEMPLVNEFSVVYDILDKMSDAEKTDVAKRWVDLVAQRLREDERGDPMTFFVDEMKVVFLCLPDLEQKFWNEATGTMGSNEMRKHLTEIAKSIM